MASDWWGRNPADAASAMAGRSRRLLGFVRVVNSQLGVRLREGTVCKREGAD